MASLSPNVLQKVKEWAPVENLSFGLSGLQVPVRRGTTALLLEPRGDLDKNTDKPIVLLTDLLPAKVSFIGVGVSTPMKDHIIHTGTLLWEQWTALPIARYDICPT